jgi:DNA-binding SARP family transcriptional activator/class 3 adenylate cyclase
MGARLCADGEVDRGPAWSVEPVVTVKDYRVLGPLEVMDGTRRVEIGPGKLRSVLAILLLNANQVVSTDRLVDELWGDRPPATAAKALQVYVSQLRKALGRETIVTRSPGYELQAPSGALDLDRFQRLREEAAAAANDPARAAALLGEALDLWRGPALADLAYEPFVQAEAARAEELRLAALEDRLEALLALGRHSEVAAELEAVVRAHPTRERLRRAQMLALYRSGRQADALEAYRSARAALVEELGLEPGPALRELERAILEQDPALDPPREAAPPRRPPPVAAPPLSSEREERKIATVLFADLVGSTALGDTEDPERMRALLTRFYDAMAREIAAAGGTVEKFVGDAVMAVFGAPVAYEDHAERALHAALAMQRRLRELSDRELMLHCGVHTGEVVVGRAHEGGSFVTGDAVNVAARLEQAAESGEILVGDRTATIVEGAFELGELRVVEAKGKPLGVACRALYREIALSRPRGVRGLGRAFVGREQEVRRVRELFDDVAAGGRPHLVTIVGEAGAGKTRLATELWDLAGSFRPAPVRLSGRCLPYGRGITYWPLGEMLKQHYGVRESDRPDALLAQLGGRAILGLSVGLPVAGDLSPRRARDRLHQAWVDFVEELASRGPVLLLVEDLHWAEEEFLDLLERIISSVRGPLVVLATARPELLAGRPGWGGARRAATTVELAPLSAADAARMVTELLGAEPPPEVSELVGRAEGNPFFVEELLATLIDRGVLQRADDGWSLATTPGELHAPDTVRAVIASRIDLLAPDDKAALQAASVIGRVFWSGPVYDLVGDADPDFLALEDREFIRRRPGSSIAGETEFDFKHQLTREVAYGTLTRRVRARLHAAFAGWLERFGGDRDEHAPLLAHHYAAAVRAEDADLVWAGHEREHEEMRRRAVVHLVRAGDLAYGRYAMEEAAALYEQAIALQPDAPARAELWRRVAEAHYHRFHIPGFREAMERAIELAGDGPQAAPLIAKLALEGSRPYVWQRPPAREEVESWVARALQLAGEGTAPRAVALIARASLDPRTAGRDAEEAVELSERLGDVLLRSLAYEVSANARTAAGDLKAATAWVERYLQLVGHLDDPDRIAGRYMHAAFAFLRRGDVRRARWLAVEHDAVSAPLSVHHAVHAVAVRVLVATLTGDIPATLPSRMETAADANQDTPCQFNWRSLLMCAAAAAERGDERSARGLERHALDLMPEGCPVAREPAALRLALAVGDRERVRRHLSENPGADSWDVDYGAARLDALAAIGDAERVEEEAQRALELGGYVEPFALRALGRVRSDEALQRRAAERFSALGLSPRVTRELARA